ncbi:MAG: hypothetical protein DRI46_12445, partial [Chloroflexi bacterium]
TAVHAKNCLLLSGELRGLHAPRAIADLTATAYAIKSAFRIVRPGQSDLWQTFPDQNTNFLKGVIVNDLHDRYYWTTESTPAVPPQYNTLARIETGDPSYILGVPQPINTPTAVADGSGVGDVISRAYGYTFVSEYGEEGPISPLVISDGKPDDVWTVGNMDVSVPDAADRPNFTKRIYRSISSTLGTALFFVAEVPLVDVSYIDSDPDNIVGLNSILISANFFPPPEDLEGILTHPNGFVVGFSGRDLYFSEPYRPHAYPPEYVVSTEHRIVGLGIFGDSIAVMTDGYPSVATGTHPATVSLADAEFSEPCMSKFGIVSMPFGVYYPGPNGLMLVNNRGVNNATEKIITKDEWELDYFPKLINASRWQDFYLGFFTESDGFMFSPSEQNAAFTEMDKYWRQNFMATDPESGNTISVFENIVYLWNPPDGLPLTYIWRSREFRIPNPVNFGAYRVYWDKNVLSSGAIGDVMAFNRARMDAGPLNTFNMHTFNSGDIYDISPTVVENKMPFGGNPLFDTTFESANNRLVFRAYANDVLVYENTVDDEDQNRLPTGFKADRWSFELEGNVNVRQVVIAETGKELRSA